MLEKSWMRKAVWIFLVGIHLCIIASIARQPLGVNRHSFEGRSVVWGLYNDSVHRAGPSADLFSVYHAGVKLAADEDPYERKESPRVTPYYYPFRYLPIVGLTLGKVLNSLGPDLARWAWIGFQELMLALSILLFYTKRNPHQSLFVGFILLLSTPYFLEVHMGQFTFVATVLVAWSCFVLEENKKSWQQVAASLGLTFSFILKIFHLIIVPALGKSKRSVMLFCISAALFALFSIPYFLEHEGSLNTFVRLNFTQPTGGLHTGNFSLAYVFLLLGKSLGLASAKAGWTKEILSVHSLVLAGTGALVFFSKARNISIMAASMLLGHFLSYVHVWEHHYSAVVITGLMLWSGGLRENNASIKTYAPFCLLGLIAPSLFYWLDLAKDPTIWSPDASWSYFARISLAAPKVISTVVLYGLGVQVLVKNGFAWPMKRPLWGNTRDL
jgi:hypothetical protein